MFDDNATRRNLLKAGAGLAAGGFALSWLPSVLARNMMAPGVARTVAVDPPTYVPSSSNEVNIKRVTDPAETGREQVVRVTSESETTHYAFSIARVRKQKLTVDDITSLSYDYFVPDGETNTVGDRPSVAPDEVWLILQIPGHGREEVFRTWPIQEEYQTDTGEWITRDVQEEFSGLDQSPWKKLAENSADFQRIGHNLDQYADARILGVGVGRGDPVMGPSEINIYYDNLRVNGKRYSFPA